MTTATDPAWDALREFDDSFEREWFEDNYAGHWDSLEEFAEDLLDQTGDLTALPEGLRSYFDFDSYGRDLELGGDVFTIEATTTGYLNGIYVFWNH